MYLKNVVSSVVPKLLWIVRSWRHGSERGAESCRDICRRGRARRGAAPCTVGEFQELSLPVLIPFPSQLRAVVKSISEVCTI
jgi:hypothetical protein